MTRFLHTMDPNATYTDEQIAQKLAMTGNSLTNAGGALDEFAVKAALVEAGVHPSSWDETNWEVTARRAIEIRGERQ